MKRILITGSRDWTDAVTIADAITEAVGDTPPAEVTIVHGGARGADTLAGEFATSRGFSVEVHPADWTTHGKMAGPIRNREMGRTRG